MTLALTLLSLGSSSPKENLVPVTVHSDAKAEGNSQFALELFARLSPEHPNLILSPFSISSTMAMAYGGARGNTANQIEQACHFATNGTALHSSMASLAAALTNSETKNLKLRVANALWLERDYPVVPGFSDLCRKYYDTQTTPMNFSRGAADARRDINRWLEGQTEGKIKDFFAPNGITAETRLVIVNAIYFKGHWLARFKKADTRMDKFWVSTNNAVEVPMMRQSSLLSYASDDRAQMVALPYAGASLAMLVVLPKDTDGISNLETHLTVETLNHLVGELRPCDVDVHLPKFKLGAKFSLIAALSSMGAVDAFSPDRANFTGISPRQPLFINACDHAAIIEVDEDGTTAAAVTGVSFGCSAKPQSATFHADHPFLFLIMEQSTGTVLFLGKVSNPAG